MFPDEADQLMKMLQQVFVHTVAIVKDRFWQTDCVSRSFCPKLAIAEDPVCGSAHCQIADYWSGVLGKKKIQAYQASKRGGYLYCEMLENGRRSISGKAARVAISDIVAKL